MYYKVCTKYVPVLYFELQSLHRVLPSTTLHYKACTKHFTVLLCTTKPACLYAHSSKTWQQSCSHYTRICNQRANKRIELRRRTDSTRNNPSRNRRTQEVPFLAGCSHLHGKTQGFLLWLPPQNKPHATATQLLHRVLQHDVAPSLYAHDDKTWQQSCSHCADCFMMYSYDAVWCIVMWCSVSHHPSHTTLHDVLVCDVKSLHDVLLCHVKSLE